MQVSLSEVLAGIAAAERSGRTGLAGDHREGLRRVRVERRAECPLPT